MDDSNQSIAAGHLDALFRLDSHRLAVPINGFLMPLITVVTLINNNLVLAVLLRRQMRSPTNALLAALAVSDTLMILCPLPCFLHFTAEIQPPVLPLLKNKRTPYWNSTFGFDFGHISVNCRASFISIRLDSAIWTGCRTRGASPTSASQTTCRLYSTRRPSG